MEKLSMTDTDYQGLSQIIKRLQFFRLMKGAQFDRLLARMELCAYERGETIFHKGDSPLAFYLVYTGLVRIHLGYRYWGLMRRFANLNPGNMFGEIGIFEKRLRSATAVAAKPTKLFVLGYEQFDELMKADADFSDVIKFIVSSRKAENQR